MSTTHPRHDLNDELLHPVRLSVVAALADVDRAQFGLVRDSVEVSDSALSKQVARLERAGYVAVEKGRVGRQSRTWLSLTAVGATVYRRHLHALEAVAATGSAGIISALLDPVAVDAVTAEPTPDERASRQRRLQTPLVAPGTTSA